MIKGKHNHQGVISIEFPRKIDTIPLDQIIKSPRFAPIIHVKDGVALTPIGKRLLAEYASGVRKFPEERPKDVSSVRRVNSF